MTFSGREAEKMDSKFVSVAELSRRLQSREVSAVELARGFLERIEAAKA